MRDAAERLSPMQRAMACRTTFKFDLIGVSLINEIASAANFSDYSRKNPGFDARGSFFKAASAREALARSAKTLIANTRLGGFARV